MSADARRATPAEGWTQWEGQVVNGLFPLRRFLGASDHSAVFLTGTTAEGFLNAAIKLVPADLTSGQTQLAYWRTAASLSHPNLLRLFDCGHCQLGAREFIFLVMEYAEETLSEILPIRALEPDEVRELLLPTFAALTYLHGRNLVHAQLKPSNFLVVNDQLKLSSDTIRPIGQPVARIGEPSLYDPPEAINGCMSTAGDVWELGVTMVEALTQHPPRTTDERSDVVSLPATVPPTFVYIVRHCLNRNPADRPTVMDLEGQLIRAPVTPAVPVPPPVMRATPRDGYTDRSPKRSVSGGFVMLIVVLAAVGGGFYLFKGRQGTTPAVPTPDDPSVAGQTQSPQPQSANQPQGAEQPQATGQPPATGQPQAADHPATQSRAAPSSGVSPTQPAGARSVNSGAPAPSATRSSATPDGAGGAVLHEEIPDPSRSARETIHGHIKVAVRVTVDRSGNVVDENLADPGPSKYFARLATTAARKWRFSPAADSSSREWLLHFEFTRDGTSGHAVGPRT